MQLYLPDSYERDALMHLHDELIDEFDRVVRSAQPKMIEVASAEGAPRNAASAFLMRGLELLKDARLAHSVGAHSVVELALRPMFELACVGRYLLRSPDSSDQFSRMLKAFVDQDRKTATDPTSIADLPAFIASLLDENALRPRDLAALAKELDRIDGLDPSDAQSTTTGYNIYGRWMSNYAIHGGLGSIKRFLIEDSHACLLQINEHPAPLTSDWPIPLAAMWLGELALDVFEAFKIDVAELQELDLRRGWSDDDLLDH